jgi:hypothetical protein
MFRKLFVVFSIACLALPFAACNSGGEPKKDEKIEERKPTAPANKQEGDKNDGAKILE